MTFILYSSNTVYTVHVRKNKCRWTYHCDLSTYTLHTVCNAHENPLISKILFIASMSYRPFFFLHQRLESGCCEHYPCSLVFQSVPFYHCSTFWGGETAFFVARHRVRTTSVKIILSCPFNNFSTKFYTNPLRTILLHPDNRQTEQGGEIKTD